MLLLCHGGKCCGIKHIHGFDWHPTIGLLPKEHFEQGEDYDDNCPYGTGGAGWQSWAAGKNYFEGDAPEENALSRLDRLLAYCKQHQPRGVIEVTLIKEQKSMWHNILEERDFHIVTEFVNSNTQHTIWIYHKVNK